MSAETTPPPAAARPIAPPIAPDGPAPVEATEPRRRPAVRVRRGTVDDLAVVVELRLALLREHAGNPVYGRLRRDARARAERLFAAQLAARGEVTFLAERDGEVVGILRCIDSHGSPLLHPDRYGYVASVYVRPTARRGGVLRALVGAAERWSERRGLTELRLHNAADNPLATAAWSDLGFEVAEVLRVRPLRPARRGDTGGA